MPKKSLDHKVELLHLKENYLRIKSRYIDKSLSPNKAINMIRQHLYQVGCLTIELNNDLEGIEKEIYRTSTSMVKAEEKFNLFRYKAHHPYDKIKNLYHKLLDDIIVENNYDE